MEPLSRQLSNLSEERNVKITPQCDQAISSVRNSIILYVVVAVLIGLGTIYVLIEKFINNPARAKLVKIIEMILNYALLIAIALHFINSIVLIVKFFALKKCLE
ncbi:BVpp13b-like protein [Chelonus insularis]|nr:BVpp13b-like protein [Chelonus insularis]